MDPNGRIVSEDSARTDGLDAFQAEIAAAFTLSRTAIDHRAERIRVHTDCKALVELWIQHRDDLRLTQLRALARRLQRFELRAIPRLHNQPANLLARQALQLCARRAHKIGAK
jgi:hypothetical protein